MIQNLSNKPQPLGCKTLADAPANAPNTHQKLFNIMPEDYIPSQVFKINTLDNIQTYDLERNIIGIMSDALRVNSRTFSGRTKCSSLESCSRSAIAPVCNLNSLS